MEVARVTVVVAALVSGLTACGSGDTIRDVGSPATTGPAATWSELPPGPLSPRAGAVGVWTGSEVLVIGGEPEAWCPALADCTPPEFAPLADGAAYDPVSGRWRRIADAPLTFSSNASAVAVGDEVYVLVRDASYRPGGAGGFLRYVPADDRWEQLPAPAADTSWYQLATAGGRLVAYPGSAEAGEFPDMVFDPASDSWRRLPADPLAPSFDRTMVGVGDDLYLFAHDLVENPGSERPSLTRAARLDLTTARWEPRANSEILGSAPWFVEDGVLVNPRLDRADGGEVNNWGRTYPAGGVYDSTADAWRPLPNPPPGVDVGGSGVIGRSQASFFDVRGVVLDLVTGRWVSIPRLPDDTDRIETSAFNRTIVTAGTDLFVFGGELWTDDDGTVLDTGYVWPSRSADTGTPRPQTTSTSTLPPSTSLPTPSTGPLVVASPPATSSPPALATSAPTVSTVTADVPLLRFPFDDGDEMDALISGTLTLDRDCLLLGGADPPVPVVWPAGATWSDEPPMVALPDGQDVPLGAEVFGGGGYGSVDEVEFVLGREAAAIAAACLGPTGEVAIFNAGEQLAAVPRLTCGSDELAEGGVVDYLDVAPPLAASIATAAEQVIEAERLSIDPSWTRTILEPSDLEPERGAHAAWIDPTGAVRLVVRASMQEHQWYGTGFEFCVGGP